MLPKKHESKAAKKSEKDKKNSFGSHNKVL